MHIPMGQVAVCLSHLIFLLARLTPSIQLTKVFEECKMLAGYVKTVSGPVLVLGDFNSISPLDKARHEVSVGLKWGVAVV